VKEGKTIFRLAAGQQSAAAPANITPLLKILTAAGAVDAHGHAHAEGDECPGEATAVLAAMLAGGPGGK
jgi:hypothetical protein